MRTLRKMPPISCRLPTTHYHTTQSPNHPITQPPHPSQPGPWLAGLAPVYTPWEALINDGLTDRFAALPVTNLRQNLQTQASDLEGEVEKLGKRLLYLETTHKNSKVHIEQMLRSR